MSAKKAVTTPLKNKLPLPVKPKNSVLLIGALVLIIITAAIYYKSLNIQLTTWDDDYNITNNPDIRTLHGDSVSATIKKTFTSYASGNYHPLTMLSLALDYNKHQLDPKSYHETNLIFHILNTLLVFCFIWLLTQQHWVAFITALLFSIHPMHVESVAWASERKDVLYSFFYLGALCTYLFYLKKEKWKIFFYLLTFFLFSLAVLSKAMAVSLPIAFLVVDFFLDRKLNIKNNIDKIPFILLSLIFGYVAIQAQKSSNAVHVDYYNLIDRILFTCYGIMMYVWKLFVPINLSCYYNYPTKLNGVFPAIVYVSPVIIAAAVFLIYRYFRVVKDSTEGKVLIFGFGFFIISIALVLQILPVGGAIISDRYTYLPYVGLFFMIAYAINNLLENRSEKYSKFKIASIAALVLFSITCCYLSFQRTKVWHDSISLWNNAIENEKFDISPTAYKSRATAYFMAGKYDKAILDYDQYINIINNNPDVFCDRGIAYYNSNKFEEALKNFDRAIQLDPNDLRSYHFRGLSNVNLKKYEETIIDFTKTLELKPDQPFAYYTRGLAYYYLLKYEEALKDYTLAINLNPAYTEAYSNRGLAYFQTRKFEEAIKDYTTAISINPKYSNAYYNRALVYDQLKKYDEAIKDYSSTIQIMPEFAGAYNSRGMDYFAIPKFELALNDLLKAKQMGFAVDENLVKVLEAGVIGMKIK